MIVLSVQIGQTMTSDSSVPHWRIVSAAILDFFTIFFAGGFLVGALTGNLTSDGFEVEGLPALLLIVLIIAYFKVGSKYGGTLWQRIFRTRT